MKVTPEPGGNGRRRIRRIYLLAGALLVVAMAFAVVSLAGQVGTNSGFEDDDANLAASSNTVTDWNTFAPVTWNGTSPKRLTASTGNGWSMSGFEDFTATTKDDGFAGGTKQDNDCGSVITSKAPNKDDLKRVYLATKTVKVNNVNHVFLSLAFVRIPLNSTQSSTHIGFEFNEQRLGACDSGPLSKRTPQAWGTTDNSAPHSGGDPSNPGDLLLVYDYEGSTTSPTLSLRHWIDSGSTIGQSCEISQDSPPCWSTATTLPAGVAEAQVNFGANNVPGAGVIDSLAPTSSSNGASHNEALGLKEFGEAGVDLTAAGVFQSNVCIAFGQSEAVSRSSGNSGTAQMEDLVSGPFNINNCGRLTIIKHTNPRGLDQAFTYTSNLNENSNAGGVSGVDASGNFSLNDNGNSTTDSTANKVSEGNLQPNTYTITEGADPTGFAFNSVTCDSNHATITNRTVSVALVANDTITCTYVNDQQLGAIKITKTSSKAAATALSGAHFRICTNGTNGADPPATCTVAKAGSDDLPTGSDGTVCIDNVPFGDYYVSEKSPPSGYAVDDTHAHKVTVNVNGATCTAATFTGQSISFTDTPLTDLLVTVTSEVSGATKSGVKCVNSSNADVGNSPQPTGAGDLSDTTKYGDPVTLRADGTHGGALKPGTYTCTIIVDP
jgi:hypothetical protein